MENRSEIAGTSSLTLGWRLVITPVACCALIFPAFAAAQEHCQPSSQASDDALGARYAPILRFAPGEQYYPTIPYFHAFDAADNNGDGLTDYEDPDEIAPFGSRDSARASWERTAEWYDEELRRGSPDSIDAPPVVPLPAVFYRVRDLSSREHDDLWRYLRTDLLEWDRSGESEWRTLGLEAEPFKVIEYYFYYVRDRGLVGHPHDIEFVFVFLPADPALACQFRVVVGAGHTERVPNNVLVLSNESVLGHTDLARRDTLTNVIVELGGHSSSPDLPPYGRFMFGIDVNWQIAKSWGTRDVQAISQLGFQGEYRADMTLPRDSASFPVVLWPRGAGKGGQEYTLFPASLFESIHDLLQDTKAHRSQEQWAGSIAAISAALDSVGILLGRDITGLEGLDSALVRRMSVWNQATISDPNRPEGGELAPHRAQVWEHWQYTTNRSTLILKPHLFPPSMASIRTPSDVLRLITWGYSVWPGSGHEFDVGLVVPWFHLPIPVRGFLELQAGIGTDTDFDGTEFSLEATYVSSYFQRAAWYTTVSWIPNPTVTGSHFTVGAGPSLLLWSSPHKSLLGPINILRLSTGPRFRLSSGSTSAPGVDWEFTLSFRQ